MAAIAVRDLPFMAPPDKVIAIDLPPPLSVNRTRRVNWAARGDIEKWVIQADMRIMAGGGVRRLGKIPGQFECRIILDEDLCGIDADNGIKMLVDYCRRIELITDDSKKYLRRLVVEWGEASTGCRVILREWGA